ncbi:UDP-glucose 4-epimerase [Sinorhizobium sojae CCBAU 05684]|uniref:UDP-glucose 4-epimerase n=1 Tax=Sinorhizobium sojae CCBAU 05684 TaxID=716928 RepID=A0A249PH83_9HYPH|nr:NAD(P)-dependent oxidoreductase [Sinorhizobium sojae]ASY65102.1 UDP-glucose 4-epimerase [Sinorhizobium sojae CCBAU 05684]
MTILVTGSAGHLGEALMRVLREAGRDVRGIDIKPSDFTDIVGTIADRAFIPCAMKDVRAVIHAATLHKPHVATHGYSDFVETNIAGTLNLLDAAAKAGVDAFVFTSTTSAFGSALTPPPDAPAAWITEDVASIPRNIYGTSKVAAEGFCELFARRHGLPVIILRTSRFFPEADDDAEIRSRFETANTQANELLHRRVDIEDVVSAHLLAADRAKAVGFGLFIVSAPTPFARDDRLELRRDAPSVVHRLYPECHALYAERGWQLFPSIDRVYISTRATEALGWKPKYDFRHVLSSLARGKDFQSPLARAVGLKGYHDTVFADGPYPIA